MTPRRWMALLLALAAGLAVAGCGGDDEGAPIPQATATALNAELDGVQRRLDQGSAGACEDILGGPNDPNMDRVEQLIDSLPDDVDADVRSALEESFNRLWDLVQQDCDDKAQQEESQQEPEETTPEETTPEETTPEETTPEETTPEETTPEETTPPEEEPLPPEGDGDNGGGIPGTGNGGGVGPGAKAGKKEKSK